MVKALEKRGMFLFWTSGQNRTVLTEENDLPKQDQQTQARTGIDEAGQVMDCLVGQMFGYRDIKQTFTSRPARP
jgi:hypothetical protein